MLQHEIKTNPAVLQPSSNSLYLVFLPPGVLLTLGGDTSCKSFCSYHKDISAQIFYAVIPYPGCATCNNGMNPLDALTVSSSHSLVESITDPIPGHSWYDDEHGEIADICAQKLKHLGTNTVHLKWSNRAGACI